jgi:hypothetical protein
VGLKTTHLALPSQQVSFSGTTHVQHLPSHPEAYAAAIGRLLDRTLG